MLEKILTWLLGCRHPRYTFPRSPRPRWDEPAAALTGTYVACLDCGRKLPYDWDAMRVVRASHRRRSRLTTLPDRLGDL